MQILRDYSSGTFCKVKGSGKMIPVSQKESVLSKNSYDMMNIEKEYEKKNKKCCKT